MPQKNILLPPLFYVVKQAMSWPPRLNSIVGQDSGLLTKFLERHHTIEDQRLSFLSGARSTALFCWAVRQVNQREGQSAPGDFILSFMTRQFTRQGGPPRLNDQVGQVSPLTNYVSDFHQDETNDAIC
ncbi:MAG: hypothetical protein IIB44_07525 [Candidatus Marinimicrobia bacterium]|nr:hypothetical protein [Candidatus Neomarinimicrobiota bacterium]